MEELVIKIMAEASGVAQGCQEATSEVNNMASEVENQSGSMAESFKQIGSAIAAAFSADKIADFLGACNELNQTQWQSETTFATIAKNRLKMGDEEIAQWKEKAAAIQKNTTFGDEATLAMWASAGAILGNKDALAGLTPAIADLTSFMYGANASTEQYIATGNKLAKAAQTGQLRSLETLGIYLDGDYATAWENATSAEERAKIVADYLQGSVGGLAETVANTAGGAIAQFNNAWSDCKEKMGEAIAPIIQVVATKLKELASYLQEHPALLQAIAIVLGVVAAAMVVYSTATAVAAIAQSALLAPILVIVAAIAAVIAIIVVCIKHWDDITAAIQRFAGMCAGAMASVRQTFSNIGTFIQAFVQRIKDKFGLLGDFIGNCWDKICGKTDASWGDIADTFSNDWKASEQAYHEATDAIEWDTKEVAAQAREEWAQAHADASAETEGMAADVAGNMESMSSMSLDSIMRMTTGAMDSFSELSGGASVDFSALAGMATNTATSTGEATSELATATQDMSAQISTASQNASKEFSNMAKDIDKAMKDAVKSVQNAVKSLKDSMNFTWDLPKLKMPHIHISGHFSVEPPSAPSYSVSWYAKGGVFDKTTMFNIGGLGEDGAEAIVPLENNTEWLDKIAERLNGSANKQIILQVDGKTFAQTSIASINALTKQTGKLGLSLA